MIATSPYQPSHVCFAPDHSIYVLGDEDLLPENERTDYYLLRHYSRGGQLLGEFFPRASFPADARPGQPRVGFWTLRIASDRIGVKLTRAGANKQHLWLETNLEGKETGPWTVPFGGEPPAGRGSRFSSLRMTDCLAPKTTLWSSRYAE